MYFCAVSIVGHDDISAMVRPQPKQSGVVVSIVAEVCMTQTWLQGEAGFLASSRY